MQFTNLNLDQLINIVGGKTVNFRGKTVYVGTLEVAQGYGVKSGTLAVAFGTLNLIPTVSVYTENILRAWFNRNGLNVPIGSGVRDANNAISFGKIGGVESVSFYTESVLRAYINSGGLFIDGAWDITFNTTGRGIKWSDVAVTMGTLSATHAIGFYTDSTLRAWINSGGIHASTYLRFDNSGTGIFFAGVTTVAILGTSTSIDMYVNNVENLGVVDNGSSTTESPLYLKHNNTLKQCHWIDGGDGFRYLAVTG